MTNRPTRAGASGPTLLVALCGLLGVTAACCLGLHWGWLGAATCVALAALLIAAYRDGQRQPATVELLDAADAIRLANDPGPVPSMPASAAELGAQLMSDADLRDALRRWNRGQR